MTAPSSPRSGDAGALDDEPIDPAALAGLRDLGAGDPEFLPNLMTSYSAHVERAVAGMRGAVAARDRERIRILAHGLRGGSGQFGARRLASLCAQIEAAVKSGAPDLGGAVDAIAVEGDRVRRRLAADLRPARRAADPRRETPLRLGLDLKTQRLTVTWHDGHVSTYGAGYLRWICPCAGCRGHAPGDVMPPSWEHSKDVTVVDAAQVGGYAIQLSFSDGHATGIYAFDRLREACPCETCGRAVATSTS